MAKKLSYITGRMGNAHGGLSVHLSTLSKDFDVLAIDAVFLRQRFEDQVQATREFCNIGEGFIIANSYGAYLLLQSLIDQPPLPVRVLLLSPVLGRAMDRERMLFSRPPREKTLHMAIENRRIGIPAELNIVTGNEDEICDHKLATHFAELLGARVSILEGEGHMIDPNLVSQTVNRFLGGNH